MILSKEKKYSINNKGGKGPQVLVPVVEEVLVFPVTDNWAWCQPAYKRQYEGW